MMRDKINFLTFFWGSKYTEEHINILFNALTDTCGFPFELHVMSDRPLEELNPGIQQYSLWPDHACEGRCWRRLRGFCLDTMAFLGHYIQLDIDVFLMPGFGDLAQSIYGNKFTLCRSENPHKPRNPYSGTIWQVDDLGLTDRIIWREFIRLKHEWGIPLNRAAVRLHNLGYNGSDSAIIGWCMSKYRGEVKSIGAAEGIVSFPHHIVEPGLNEPPDFARVVLFHGQGNDYMREELIFRYKFIRDYLDKYSTKKVTCGIIDELIERFFGSNVRPTLRDNLRAFSSELISIGGFYGRK